MVANKDGYPDEQGFEDEYVDIMTLPEAVSESAKDITNSREQPQDIAVMENTDEIMSLNQSSSETPCNIEEGKILVLDLLISKPPVDTVTTTNTTNDSSQIYRDQDLESLISFSEADDITVDQDLEVQVETTQVSIEQASQDTAIASEEPDVEGKVSSQATENITPSDSVGINEIGQFVTPEINIFEDPTATDESSAKNNQTLDGSVIFCFSAQQALITSPPKRQIFSQENVLFTSRNY